MLQSEFVAPLIFKLAVPTYSFIKIKLYTVILLLSQPEKVYFLEKHLCITFVGNILDLSRNMKSVSRYYKI
jgi:hypothetical protein